MTSNELVQNYRGLYSKHATDAAHSFRFRLREAAKAALTLGDELLQMSQDSSEPTPEQLCQLRDLESSLDNSLNYRLPAVKPKAAA